MTASPVLTLLDIQVEQEVPIVLHPAVVAVAAADTALALLAEPLALAAVLEPLL
jgi:hypothetical protein